MKLAQMIGASSLLLALAATPVLADNGKGNNKHHNGRGHASSCPPGLAKKSPACIPPGQVGRHGRDHDRDRDRDHVRYGNGVGEVLRIGDYTIIRDLDRYGLQDRDDWRYYRDDDRIYRVDSNTQKVLAVLNLIDAFTN
ncbi:MAG: hypothetical protein DI616_00060 [Paracoccus denitrificans]|uniref:Excinuclease ABC subunit A n=1 Tax=Paracoccus denitrificans TaxID=266 RepID=A0A533IFU3_PARDE|nr:MAG: hypothetical protein DI616_00060 [Paracoccus denitrificans]